MLCDELREGDVREREGTLEEAVDGGGYAHYGQESAMDVGTGAQHLDGAAQATFTGPLRVAHLYWGCDPGDAQDAWDTVHPGNYGQMQSDTEGHWSDPQAQRGLPLAETQGHWSDPQPGQWWNTVEEGENTVEVDVEDDRGQEWGGQQRVVVPPPGFDPPPVMRKSCRKEWLKVTCKLRIKCRHASPTWKAC